MILLSVVVLPAPLRPTSAISPPAGISKLIPRKNTKTFDRDADTIHVQHGYS